VTTPKAAAIYARISLDHEDLGKGVDRQVADCKKLAKQLGWTVAHHYVDNNISAYSGKRRPEYEQMLADMELGAVDAVLCYNLDRLTRQPREFERFNDIAIAAGITDVRFVTGGMDFGTDDGLFIGRIQAAAAAQASAATSRRIKRKNEERAAEGKPHGGSTRPYGFEADRVTHNKAEAKIIRQLAARYLAGESLGSLTSWLQDQHVPTVTGKKWRTHTVRQVISSPRVAGLRDHRGEIVRRGVWKPIISQADRDRILAMYETKKTSGRRPPRRYLLSGLLRCSLCDHTLYAAAREGTRRYVCSSGPDHGGCGKITVVAAPLDQLIADAVLYRLDSPELADALAGQARKDEDTAALLDEVSADREQLEELAAAHGNRAISMPEWMAARKPIDDRLRANERRLRQATNTGQLASLQGQGDELRRQWGTLNLDRQVAIVKAVLDHVIITPGTPGARSFDRHRAHPQWRC